MNTPKQLINLDWEVSDKELVRMNFSFSFLTIKENYLYIQITTLL